PTPNMARQTPPSLPTAATAAAIAPHQQLLQPQAYPAQLPALGGYIPAYSAPQMGGNYHQPHASFGPQTTPYMGYEMRQFPASAQYHAHAQQPPVARTNTAPVGSSGEVE